MLEGIKDKDHFWNVLKYSGLLAQNLIWCEKHYDMRKKPNGLRNIGQETWSNIGTP